MKNFVNSAEPLRDAASTHETFCDLPRQRDARRRSLPFNNAPRHHPRMRLASWIKAKSAQVDLFAGDALSDVPEPTPKTATLALPPALHGAPLMLPINLLHEDPSNPRTEFPEAEIDELAQDIRQHGVLQPIVVHPADTQGRSRIHFGAKRWRAAQRAGLSEVPVVIRDAPTDPYTHVAENQKRHGLTPLDLARFIKGRVDAGESNAMIAKRLGWDLTSIAHHLALLELAPALNEAMQTGRCTSPRTLYELNKLHRKQPEQVRALLGGDAQITRCAVSAVRTLPSPLARVQAACAQLEAALDRLAKAEPSVADSDLTLLKQRVAKLASRLA